MGRGRQETGINRRVPPAGILCWPSVNFNAEKAPNEEVPGSKKKSSRKRTASVQLAESKGRKQLGMYQYSTVKVLAF